MTRALWAVALGYPLGLVALAYVLMRRDPDLLFDPYYMMGTIALAPAFCLSVVFVIGRGDPAPNRILTVLTGIWVLIVSGAHLWFVSLMVRTALPDGL
ncbi:MAG: hypothetical protein AAF718_06665 [Pseudomonadota bacterium]